MSEQQAFVSRALQLVANYAAEKSALDIAHVLGDARLFLSTKSSEAEAWNAIVAHLNGSEPKRSGATA